MRAAVVVLLAVAGCTDDAIDIEWDDDCGNGVACGFVDVPYDHGDPDGGSFPLFLARVPATGSSRGAVALNFGGPGVAGTPYLRGFTNRFLSRVNEHYDIVSWDPRGTGSSEPLDCMDSWDQVLDAPLAAADAEGIAETQAVRATWVATCEGRHPELTAHMNLRQWADDLDFVRRAVGEPVLGYFGVSGGSALGQVYAELHGDRVDRMVLDSVGQPFGGMDSLTATQLPATERLLAQWAAWCRATPDECVVSADPLGAIAGVVDLTSATPIAVGDRTLNDSRAVNGIFDHLYSESLWGALADNLDLALSGDGSGLLAAGDLFSGRREDGTYGTLAAVYTFTECADSTWQPTEAELLVEGQRANDSLPWLGASFTMENGWCSHIAPAPDAIAAPPTAPGVPTILLLQSVGDFATPLAVAEAVHANLEDSVLVTWDSASHSTVSSSPCMQAFAEDYLADGVLPPEGASCP
jgi:pimeloyl-ACP methyl ester carboxylesterase